MIEITPYEIGDRNNDLKNLGADRYPGPGLAILDVEVDGPIVDAFRAKGINFFTKGWNAPRSCHGILPIVRRNTMSRSMS